MDLEDELDFPEDFNEKELFYTQVTAASNEVPCKRRRLALPSPPPQKSVSTRKNLILDIFSSEKPRSTPKESPESPKNRLPETPKNPRSLPKQLVPSPASELLKNSPSIPSRVPKTPKFLQNSEPKRLQRNFSPGTRQTPVDLQKTLVRKFPGPAGLIPDNKNASEPPETLNDLRLHDENDTNIANTSPEERKPEFCTQDTKNLFVRGAWRNMLNDLPKNFLDGYDITTIKESDATKVPRLAVVIQQIVDQRSENPRVILRDISDSIEGIMHRDLAMNYPNILRSGVVLLLKDVGVLSCKLTSFVKTKVIVFSIDSVIAVYSEQGTMVKAPGLDDILRDSQGIDEGRGSGCVDLEAKDVRSDGKECGNGEDSKRKVKDDDVDGIVQLGGSDDVNDEFGDDFNFDDDAFDEIDDDDEDCGGIVETVAVIERGVEEGSQEKGSGEDRVRDDAAEISSGFCDDLLNDSDSDDEYLSQIDIDAISRARSFNG